MPEILNEFVIEPVQATVVIEPNNINVTPNAIGLNIYTGAAPVAGGSNTNVQWNQNGVLGGANSFTFDYATEVVNIGNLQITNVANLGGTANVVITGGANAYFLQTDGTGNLTWAPGTSNATGNGTAAGANTQIQFTDGAGNFQAAAGFTFDNASNVMNAPGDLIVAGNITAAGFIGNSTNANFANYAGYVVNGNQSNITAVGALGNLTVTNTISGNIITTTGNITGPNIIANNNFYGNVIGNLSGNATTAGTVVTNAQPNITSLGTLTGLQIAGDLNVLSNTIYANVLQANVITTGNISTTGNANIGTNLNVTTNANITGNVNANNISITGNANFNDTTFVQQIQEKVTVITSTPSSTYTYNVLDQLIVYNTANATTNLTLNFIGNGSVNFNTFMSNANSVVATYLMTTGASSFSINNVQIDGSAQTINWAGNATPNTYIDAIMSYTFTLIKTASNTYTVLGSATRYG